MLETTKAGSELASTDKDPPLYCASHTCRFDPSTLQDQDLGRSSQAGSTPYLQQLKMLSNYDGHTLFIDYQDLLLYDHVLAGAIEDQYYR